MARTLPYSAYVDDERLSLERRHVFAGSWQYVGSIFDLADHTALPVEIHGVPVVLTRQGDDVGALVNVCAHRGSIVCRAPSSTESLSCPYHAWRYALDGSLIRAPRSERETGFVASDHGLERLPLGRWGPFLFVATRPSPISFETFLGNLPELVMDAGVDVDDLVFHHRARSELAANWKIVVENFLECYHCRVAHPAFSKAIATAPDDYHLATAATFSSQYGPVNDSWRGSYDPNGEVNRGQFHLLYPNTAINVMPGRPNLSIGPINPTSPTTTARFLDYFFGSDVPDSWIEPMIEFDDQVGREDVVLVEDMQRGVSARPERRGTLFLDSEKLIAHFEAYVEEKVARELSSPGGG